MDPLWWGNGGLAGLRAAASAARLVFWVTLGAMGLLIGNGVLQEVVGGTASVPSKLYPVLAFVTVFVWGAYLWTICYAALTLTRVRLVSRSLYIATVVLAAISLVGALVAAVQSIGQGGVAFTANAYRWQALNAMVLGSVTLSALLLWAIVLRQAGVRIANTALRPWALIHVGCFGLLLVMWLPSAVIMLQSAFGGFGGGSPRIMMLLGYAAMAMSVLMVPAYVLLAVNSHLLHRALRRFIAARLDSA